MRPLCTQQLIRSPFIVGSLLAPIVLAGLANTARSQTEERIPSPLPRMEDVKTPARPAPPKTDAAPLTQRASYAPSLSRPKPDPDLIDPTDGKPIDKKIDKKTDNKIDRSDTLDPFRRKSK